MRRSQDKLTVLHSCSPGRVKLDARPLKFRRAVTENFRCERWHLDGKRRAIGSIRADFATSQFPDLEERDKLLTWLVPHDVNHVRWNMPHRIQRILQPRNTIRRKRNKLAIVREPHSQIATMGRRFTARITSDRARSLFRMRTK